MDIEKKPPPKNAKGKTVAAVPKPRKKALNYKVVLIQRRLFEEDDTNEDMEFDDDMELEEDEPPKPKKTKRAAKTKKKISPQSINSDAISDAEEDEGHAEKDGGEERKFFKKGEFVVTFIIFDFGTKKETKRFYMARI